MVKLIKADMLYEIAEIEKECFSNSYGYSVLQSTINAPTFLGFAEVDGDSVKGYLLATVVLDEANIDRIAVKKDYRNQKIATRLINEFEKVLYAKKVNNVFLEVRRSNQVAINLYKSQGYKNLSERKNYYENGEDALIFKKSL